MKNDKVELQLLVNGKPVPTYGHDGRTFVEGRENTAFSLRIKNNTASRIEAVVSVDGLSVVDGEAAKPDSRGYIIPAYGAYEIPGWRMDTDKCAKFIFKKGGESYAVKSGSSSSDVGVIGLMAWSEKAKTEPIVIKEKVIEYHPVVWPHYPYPTPSPWYYGTSYTSCVNNSTTYTAGTDLLRSASLQAMNCSAQCDLNVVAQNSAQCDSHIASVAPSNAPAFDLGAGWGESINSKVTLTSFERGEVVSQAELYYSTAEALEKVGIRMNKEVAVPTGAQYPSAFKFCKPPQ